MVHESMRKLRLDRRLLRRRGWLNPEEIERELSQLPDVSDKAEVIEPDEDVEPDESAAPEREA